MSASVKIISQGDILALTIIIGCGEKIVKGPFSVSKSKFFFEVTSYNYAYVLNTGNCYQYLIRLQFCKTNKPEDETLTVMSQALDIKNRTFKNDGNLTLVYNKKQKSEFEIEICVRVVKNPVQNPFSELYDDINMTDFEMRAEDGCVSFHKAVLALSSPVLKTMFNGEWKETQEGHVDVPGISKDTIQQFKDYVYKYIVPEKVSFELMSLASYYMMSELEDLCVENIADNLTSENAWSLIEQCASQKSKKLLSTILNRVHCMQGNEESDFIEWLNS